MPSANLHHLNRKMPILARSSDVLNESCVASRICCEEFKAHRLAVRGVFHLQRSRNSRRFRYPRSRAAGVTRSTRASSPGNV